MPGNVRRFLPWSIKTYPCGIDGKMSARPRALINEIFPRNSNYCWLCNFSQNCYFKIQVTYINYWVNQQFLSSIILVIFSLSWFVRPAAVTLPIIGNWTLPSVNQVTACESFATWCRCNPRYGSARWLNIADASAFRLLIEIVRISLRWMTSTIARLD